jgi:hypothetical protein
VLPPDRREGVVDDSRETANRREIGEGLARVASDATEDAGTISLQWSAPSGPLRKEKAASGGGSGKTESDDDQFIASPESAVIASDETWLSLQITLPSTRPGSSIEAL